MKKINIVILIILGSLSLSFNNLSADVISEFSEWLEKMENLSDRMDDMEKDIDSIKDYMESAEKRGKKTDKLLSRVQALEQMESGQTMDTLKEGVSELRKDLEDQQVITAVLEKKYKQAQRPLEPIKGAIEEQKDSIAKLIARIEAQDKRIDLITTNVDKKMKPLDNLTKNLDDKIASISKLAEIANKIEKKGGSLETALLAGIPGMASVPGTATAKVEKKKPVEEKITIENILLAQGFKEAGGGFFFKDVGFQSFGSSVKVTGKVMNDSETSYSIANFRIFLFDGGGSFIRKRGFSIKGINKGNVMSFKEIISGVKLAMIGKYAIAFGKDIQPYQVTNLIPIEKGIARRGEVAIDKPKDTKPKIEEGFKDIGNSFYVRDASIKKFGSSCEITGELKSISDEYFSIAQFKIKIFNSRKELIWEQDFSVKGIRGGTIKNFSEFLTGVEPEDVDSFELKAKEAVSYR